MSVVDLVRDVINYVEACQFTYGIRLEGRRQIQGIMKLLCVSAASGGA